jgi:hypothetical protein
MLFLEAHARAWLILHAVVGTATVAVATHLVVWIRGYPRGDFRRHTSARWFATVGLALYVLEFVIGNLIYPVYKVRVRSEYLDLGSAVQADARARETARTEVTRLHTEVPHAGAAAGERPPRTLSHVARLFDVKEHWAALGLALALGAFVTAWAWEPKRDGRGAATLFVALGVGAAACAWIAAIVGLFVTSHRAIGGIS